MAHLAEPRIIIPTISLSVARVYEAHLRMSASEFHREVAKKLQSRILVAELSGQSRVDLDQAIIETAEVEESIDALVDMVIDLR